MPEKKELNQEQLEKVSGGDNGDVVSERSKTPEGVRPRYSVGQEVEVYNYDTHVSTKRSRIDEIKIVFGDKSPITTNFTGYYWPLYKVYVYEDKVYREVSSDDIES